MTSRNLERPSFALVLMIGIILWPDFALAVQGHGGAEGLVAHQIGHGLFIFSGCYLSYKIHIPRFKDPGWLEFKIFLLLMLLWNLLTFTGHWMREYADPAKFYEVSGQITGMIIKGPWDAFFYLTRLDHLFLVPAFIMLLLALRKWRRQP